MLKDGPPLRSPIPCMAGQKSKARALAAGYPLPEMTRGEPCIMDAPRLSSAAVLAPATDSTGQNNQLDCDLH